MQILLSAEQIQQRVDDLARRIANDYRGQSVTIIALLTGSIVFLADLIRRLDLPLKIGLVQASSYRGATTSPGELRYSFEHLPDLRRRNVLLLDDILDTGQTLSRMAEDIRRQEPLSIKSAVLVRKHGRQQVPFEPDYVGFDIPNAFVVGYGLDYNDEYRHLPYLAILDGPDIA